MPLTDIGARARLWYGVRVCSAATVVCVLTWIWGGDSRWGWTGLVAGVAGLALAAPLTLGAGPPPPPPRTGLPRLPRGPAPGAQGGATGPAGGGGPGPYAGPGGAGSGPYGGPGGTVGGSL